MILGCIGKQPDNNPIDIPENSHDYSKGKEIIAATFSSLSSELQKSMHDGGVENAIKYCNLKALPITDSLSQIYNADIKRTSEKWRNELNKPTFDEQEIIDFYKSQLIAGNELNAMVQKVNGQNIFYAPIQIQELCLKCHGETSKMPYYGIIKNLYPKDQAIGFELNELRGIWSVRFN